MMQHSNIEGVKRVLWVAEGLSLYNTSILTVYKTVRWKLD
jgi:hypothetical protein